MEPAERTDVFDFLYRDSSRIASYYAQLFGGLLKGVETSAQSRTATESNVRGGFALLSGDRKKIQDAVTARKEQLDPHDNVAVDMIAKLLGQRSAVPAGKDAPHGALVRVEGRLAFTDAATIKMMTDMDEDVFNGFVLDKSKKPHEAKKQAKQIRALMKGVTIPSMFLLTTDSGDMYGGTVKEVGLEEPIGSFYYTHGGQALPAVTVLGIREQSQPFEIPASMALATANAMFVQVLRDMVLSPDATRLTPIAIYRKVGQAN